MDNWLETLEDTDEPAGFEGSDFCCPMCKGVKRALEDVCKRCYHSDEYKARMQQLKTRQSKPAAPAPVFGPPGRLPPEHLPRRILKPRRVADLSEFGKGKV